MSELRLSKLDCARRQLETAVNLYFKGGDDVSIHTLASAALKILGDICNRRNVKHPLHLETMLELAIKPEYHKKVRDELRKFENFFKHADRDPDEVLAFYPKISEYWLLAAVHLHLTLTGERIPTFHAFHLWFFMTNPGLLKDDSTEILRIAMELSGIVPLERKEFFEASMRYLIQTYG